MDNHQLIRSCEFCNRHIPHSETLGTATKYITYDAPDQENKVESVRVCVECATADRDNLEEDGVLSCDICGHTGFMSAGRANERSVPEPVYRNATVQRWNVNIGGLSGSMVACEDCTPIKCSTLLQNRPGRRVIDFGEDLKGVSVVE